MPWVGRYLCPSPRLQVGLKNNNLIGRPRKGSYILAPHLVTLIVKISQKSLGLPNSYTWSLLIWALNSVKRKGNLIFMLRSTFCIKLLFYRVLEWLQLVERKKTYTNCFPPLDPFQVLKYFMHLISYIQTSKTLLIIMQSASKDSV